MFDLKEAVAKRAIVCMDDEWARDILRSEPAAVLRTVRRNKASQDVVLAGGAVRDTYYRRPVKDYDFMTNDIGSVYGVWEALGTRLSSCAKSRDTSYGPDGYLCEVFESADKTINLLYCTDYLERIKEFPDSLSKIWTDGTNVFCTQDFLNTKRTGVIKTYPRWTAERKTRIADKYPELQFEEQPL